jgi:hypothetical protein
MLACAFARMWNQWCHAVGWFFFVRLSVSVSVSVSVSLNTTDLIQHLAKEGVNPLCSSHWGCANIFIYLFIFFLLGNAWSSICALKNFRSKKKSFSPPWALHFLHGACFLPFCASFYILSLHTLVGLMMCALPIGPLVHWKKRGGEEA